MFDDLTRELRWMSSQGVRVSVPLRSDPDGYDDKECPFPDCLAGFKVQTDDWADLVRDEVVYCPICRFGAGSQSWFTPAQVDYARKLALAEMEERVNSTLAHGVRSVDRSAPRGSFLSFSFEFMPGRRTYVAPLPAGEVLEQRSACEVCGCRYASVGAAFFCPACGHNSAISTFGATLATVRASLDLIPKLPEMVSTDAAADLGRGIAENGLVKLVTAFERFAEASYDALPEPKETAGQNTFQRLEDGSRLWRSATGIGFDAILDAGDLGELSRAFQQRHLLVHGDGIVDQRYLARSGDSSRKIGQRLVVKAHGVRRAADLIEQLASGLSSDRR